MKRVLFALVLSCVLATPAFAQTVVLRGLDKVTGHAGDFSAAIGRPVRFGTLEVIARACTKSAPEETPEVKVYLEVYDQPEAAQGEQAQRRLVFNGWIFASSPGLSAIEHPNYDIWAVDCRD
ncbi:MAG TPA: DUF2155 domain-containing protein [Caulobacterales bacterium]|nr:DUF2155 domain-containing protein [Caulobacterales bacterium]